VYFQTRQGGPAAVKSIGGSVGSGRLHSDPRFGFRQQGANLVEQDSRRGLLTLERLDAL
jgi:hypothetical protein